MAYRACVSRNTSDSVVKSFIPIQADRDKEIFVLGSDMSRIIQHNLRQKSVGRERQKPQIRAMQAGQIDYLLEIRHHGDLTAGKSQPAQVLAPLRKELFVMIQLQFPFSSLRDTLVDCPDKARLAARVAVVGHLDEELVRQCAVRLAKHFPDLEFNYAGDDGCNGREAHELCIGFEF